MAIGLRPPAPEEGHERGREGANQHRGFTEREVEQAIRSTPSGEQAETT